MSPGSRPAIGASARPLRKSAIAWARFSASPSESAYRSLPCTRREPVAQADESQIGKQREAVLPAHAGANVVEEVLPLVSIPVRPDHGNGRSQRLRGVPPARIEEQVARLEDDPILPRMPEFGERVSVGIVEIP